MNMPLESKALGCIFGGAVGDALGGPTEGKEPGAIRARYGGWVEGFVDPWRPDRPGRFRRGGGIVTDDTLMVLALANVYLQKRGHLDAFDVAALLVPEITDKQVWIPELDRDAALGERLAPAEQYPLIRLGGAHADPREAGVGNMVNCGAAMYMSPVGIVNAGDPDGAYAEAIDLAGAHQQSYGREAAGIVAAAVAAAMTPDATVDTVIAACLRLAKDGTGGAIEAVVEVARRHTDWREAIGPLRRAMAPFDTVGEPFEAERQALGARRPSRTHAIEEVPLALGMLVVTGGDCVQTMLGGVNYGRDADSIAGMGGAIAGALGGVDVVPAEWRQRVATGSRKDFASPALALAALAAQLLEQDRTRWRAREVAVAGTAG